MVASTTVKKTLKGDSEACAKLVRLCKDMALIYLKSKIASGNYYLRELNEDLEDLAWDCIADLFERDQEGQFIELETYFDDKDLDNIPEGELKIEIRRLVFSKVNDGLYRIFGKHDHSLHKIIRNIKYACGKLDLKIKRIDKSNYVIFEEDPEQKIAVMPPEFLEIRLSERISGSMNMNDVMKEIEKIFRQEELYKQQFPLVVIAQVIRKAFVNNNRGKASHSLPEHSLFQNGELKDFLGDAITQYKERFYKTYVEKDKISESVFDAYIESIKEILSHHYIEETPQGDAYYDYLKQHLPELEKERYRENHRQRLEYMVKLVREDLIRRLKKEVQKISAKR